MLKIHIQLWNKQNLIMVLIREVGAVLVFIAALTCLTLYFDTGYGWYYLGGAGMNFILAYLIWPSKRSGQRNDGGWVVDLFEILIELPVNIVLWFFRSLGGIFRSAGDLDI